MTTVEVISRSPEIAPYRDAWEDVFRAASAEPSTSFEWTRALTHSHLGPDDDFTLLRVSRGGKVEGFVPLFTRRMSVLGYPVTVLSPLSEHYNTHSDLLIRNLDAESVSAFVSALQALDRRWDLFRVSNLLDGHPLLTHGALAPAGKGSAPQVRPTHASYFLELPITFDEYLSQRSPKFRNHLKRVEKKLAERSSARVLDCSSKDDVTHGFEMLLQIERLSWKHAHGTAISAVERQIKFYRSLCEGAASAGRLHLQILTIDDLPVAHNLGYLANGCYSYLKTSYDEEHKAAGVATYLRARLIETLIERGVSRLDFPAEPYEWERQWTETARWHRALTIYGPTAAGRVLGWIDYARHRRDRNGDGRRAVIHVDPRALTRPAVEHGHREPQGTAQS
jgi:CelD/BcsL family acetyltransferase involved in cellulose biosynthesis